jgi:hypothetical protein
MIKDVHYELCQMYLQSSQWKVRSCDWLYPLAPANQSDCSYVHCYTYLYAHNGASKCSLCVLPGCPHVKFNIGAFISLNFYQLPA